MTDTSSPTEVSREVGYAPTTRVEMLLEFWHYFRQNKGAMLGLVVFSTIVIVALFAPVKICMR